MAQEANRPSTTPKLPEEARELVLRLKDLVASMGERIAASRKMVGALNSIEHHDAQHSGKEGAEAAGPGADAGSPDAGVRPDASVRR